MNAITRRPALALSVLAAVLALTATAGCASASHPPSANDTPAPPTANPSSLYSQAPDQSSTATTPAAAPSSSPAGPQMLTPGQAETIADSGNTTIGTVTVESVSVTTQPAQAYGSTPANGYFVVVRIKATADPAYTQGWDVNELDFYDLVRGTHYDPGNGNAYDALSDSQSNADITATLAAGETSAGWMAFDVPSRHGRIVYAPNSDGQPLAEWSY